MPGWMITGVFGLEFWRQETVAQTESVELSEQILRLPFPRHLREFIDGGDQQRRRATVDVLIHHHHRKPFHGRLGLGELTAAGRVATIRDTPTDATWRLVHLDVIGANFNAAPG